MPEVNDCARSEMAAMTPLQLYRHLLANIRKLPPDAQTHYKHFIRQGFNSHSDETDPERIKQIMARALEDMEWIVRKYRK